MEIILIIGSDKAVVNGEEITLDSSAFEENGRTFVPVRFVFEALGADVEWIQDEKQIIL